MSVMNKEELSMVQEQIRKCCEGEMHMNKKNSEKRK